MEQNDELGEKWHTTKIVKELMKGKETHGHSLFMDKFYNTPRIIEETSWKGHPVEKQAAQPSKSTTSKTWKWGSIWCFSEKKVKVGKWRDKKAVLYPSAEFDKLRQRELIEEENL